MQTRRGFIRSLGFLFAAPAIVRVSSLMPVRVIPPLGLITLDEYSRRVLAPAMNRVAEAVAHDLIYGYQFARPAWATMLGEVV